MHSAQRSNPLHVYSIMMHAFDATIPSARTELLEYLRGTPIAAKLSDEGFLQFSVGVGAGSSHKDLGGARQTAAEGHESPHVRAANA